jgi:hypothetical protein
MVATPTQTDTYNTALDIFDRTHPLRVDADENLKVTGNFTFSPSGVQDVDITNFPAVQNVSIVPSTTGVNLFGTSDTVTNGFETTILSFTVTTAFHISQLVGWGTYDAEFLIRLNGAIVGGCRSSPSERTISVTYSVAPIAASPTDVITVTVLEYGPDLQQFRVNLLGG